MVNNTVNGIAALWVGAGNPMIYEQWVRNTQITAVPKSTAENSDKRKGTGITTADVISAVHWTFVNKCIHFGWSIGAYQPWSVHLGLIRHVYRLASQCRLQIWCLPKECSNVNGHLHYWSGLSPSYPFLPKKTERQRRGMQSCSYLLSYFMLKPEKYVHITIVLSSHLNIFHICIYFYRFMKFDWNRLTCINIIKWLRRLHFYLFQQIW